MSKFNISRSAHRKSFVYVRGEGAKLRKLGWRHAHPKILILECPAQKFIFALQLLSKFQVRIIFRFFKMFQ